MNHLEHQRPETSPLLEVLQGVMKDYFTSLGSEDTMHVQIFLMSMIEVVARAMMILQPVTVTLEAIKSSKAYGEITLDFEVSDELITELIVSIQMRLLQKSSLMLEGGHEAS